MKLLAPVKHRDAYTRAVERLVDDYLDETIFTPLFEILDAAGIPGATQKPLARSNAIEGSALKAALEEGRVWYTDGVFSGSFSPAVAKELRELGASFEITSVSGMDAGNRIFRLAADRLPPDVKVASVSSLDRARAAHEQVGQFIAEAQLNLEIARTGIDAVRAVDRITEDLQSQFVTTVKGLDFIEVSAQVTPGMREALTKELTANVDLCIKNFLDAELPEMRALVEQNAFAGFRADRLAGIIRARYGVSLRKAAFLAEQETSLLVSKYRKQQALSIGARTYKWSTSHDERVRPDHKALNGLVFSFDSPPVTCRKTGARNNPGEDFRCRCVAMPLIEIPK